MDEKLLKVARFALEMLEIMPSHYRDSFTEEEKEIREILREADGGANG